VSVSISKTGKRINISLIWRREMRKNLFLGIDEGEKKVFGVKYRHPNYYI
jgi:hypothetical protein